MENSNSAPWPEELEAMVKTMKYKPGWSADLRMTDRGQGSVGLTLCIRIECVNAYDHKQPKYIMHYMPVPPANYNRPSWMRWLFEQFLLVERHEAAEFFTIDGEHPFAPNHGPGWDPYIITQLTTDLDRRTQFTGKVKEGA